MYLLLCAVAGWGRQGLLLLRLLLLVLLVLLLLDYLLPLLEMVLQRLELPALLDMGHTSKSLLRPDHGCIADALVPAHHARHEAAEAEASSAEPAHPAEVADDPAHGSLLLLLPCGLYAYDDVDE